MTRHLTLELLLRVAERVCGTPVRVRDYGLLSSALARLLGARPARGDRVRR